MRIIGAGQWVWKSIWAVLVKSFGKEIVVSYKYMSTLYDDGAVREGKINWLHIKKYCYTYDNNNIDIRLMPALNL